MTHENYLKFTFQCLLVKFYWDTVTPIHLYVVAVFLHHQQNWAVAAETDLQSWKYLLSDSLQKRFANPCSRSVVNMRNITSRDGTETFVYPKMPVSSRMKVCETLTFLCVSIVILIRSLYSCTEFLHQHDLCIIWED